MINITKKYSGDKITFLGNRDDVSEILDSKDVFLHLCDCNEGFGITIIEAMAKGKVCIVNNKGALPEIITNGVDGFVINNSDEGIQVIENILTCREQWDEIMRNAGARARHFSINQYVKSLDEMLIN